MNPQSIISNPTFIKIPASSAFGMTAAGEEPAREPEAEEAE